MAFRHGWSRIETLTKWGVIVVNVYCIGISIYSLTRPSPGVDLDVGLIIAIESWIFYLAIKLIGWVATGFFTKESKEAGHDN